MNNIFRSIVEDVPLSLLLNRELLSNLSNKLEMTSKKTSPTGQQRNSINHRSKVRKSGHRRKTYFACYRLGRKPSKALSCSRKPSRKQRQLIIVFIVTLSFTSPRTPLDGRLLIASIMTRLRLERPPWLSRSLRRVMRSLMNIQIAF